MKRTCLQLLCLLLISISGCAHLEQQPTLNEQLTRFNNQLEQCIALQQNDQQALQQYNRQLKRSRVTLKRIEDRLTLPSPPPADITAENCSPTDAGSATDKKLVIGAREKVWLADLNLALPARIDTGAQTASLDARNIHLFERDGTRWVRFDIAHPLTEALIPMEQKLVRITRVVQSSNDKGERRPVIKLPIAIGPTRQTAEFTLSDRAHLDYQVLVGRNILKDVMLVDVSQSNIAQVNPAETPPITEAAP